MSIPGYRTAADVDRFISAKIEQIDRQMSEMIRRIPDDYPDLDLHNRKALASSLAKLRADLIALTKEAHTSIRGKMYRHSRTAISR